jgi:hypothetical protein
MLDGQREEQYDGAPAENNVKKLFLSLRPEIIF